MRRRSSVSEKHGTMTGLVRIYFVKILLTVLVWCAPLLVLPDVVADAVGLEGAATPFLLRLLGLAYLALCVGYAFGLQAAWVGQRRHGPLWAGIVSNGGAAVLLGWVVVSGTHAPWPWQAQAVVFLSAAAAALIALGLFWYALALDRVFRRRTPAPAEDTQAAAEAPSEAITETVDEAIAEDDTTTA